MPAVCDAFGIHFDYPENWELETFDDAEGGGAVIVSSPETAFFQLSRHSAGTDAELLFDEALAALRSEYGAIEAHSAKDTVDGTMVTGYNVNFYCLDLTNTCRIRTITVDSATYMVLFQAEDEEFNRVNAVFEAIFTSLLRSMG
ncbi:hypothetical protein OAS39_07865 [Pirellulales bacterium]|nr:hypothetical protein [Pirellulales bacterium]